MVVQITQLLNIWYISL